MRDLKLFHSVRPLNAFPRSEPDLVHMLLSGITKVFFSIPNHSQVAVANALTVKADHTKNRLVAESSNDTGTLKIV